MPQQLNNSIVERALLYAYISICTPNTAEWLPPDLKTAFGDQVESALNSDSPNTTPPPCDPETVNETLSKAQGAVKLSRQKRIKAAQTVAALTSAISLPAEDYVELCVAIGRHFEPNEPQVLRDEFWESLVEIVFDKLFNSKDNPKDNSLTILNQTLQREEFKYLSADTNAYISTIQIHYNAEELKKDIQNYLLNPEENHDILFKKIKALFSRYHDYVLNALPSYKQHTQQAHHYIMRFCYLLLAITGAKGAADKLWQNGQLNFDDSLGFQEELFKFCADQIADCELEDLLPYSARVQLDALIETLQSQIKDDTLNLAFFDLDETIFLDDCTNAASEEIWEKFLEELDATPILMTTRNKLFGEDLMFKRFFSGDEPLSKAFPEKYRVMLGCSLYKAHAIRYIIRELKKHNPNLTLNISLTDDRIEETSATKAREGEPDQANIVGNQVVTQTAAEQHAQTLDEFKQIGFVRKLLQQFNASHPALSEFSPGLFGTPPEEMTACLGEGCSPGI